MRIQITMRVAVDRVVAAMADGDVRYDEPNLLGLDGSTIVAMGSDAERCVPPIRVVPGYQFDPFDPNLTARVVEAVARMLWSRRRSRLNGLVAALDSVEIRVCLDDYDRIDASARAAFEKAIPYHPQMSWEIS